MEAVWSSLSNGTVFHFRGVKYEAHNTMLHSILHQPTQLKLYKLLTHKPVRQPLTEEMWNLQRDSDGVSLLVVCHAPYWNLITEDIKGLLPFGLASCLAFSSTREIENRFSETSVEFQWIIRSYRLIPEVLLWETQILHWSTKQINSRGLQARLRTIKIASSAAVKTQFSCPCYYLIICCILYIVQYSWRLRFVKGIFL
jgi:hypothetical protein